MHPSKEIFLKIRSLWERKGINSVPAFFTRVADHWEQAPANDLESFYRHLQLTRPAATTLLTSYTVGHRNMLVAHFESTTQTCHQVWSIAGDGTLTPIYCSPLELTLRRAA